MFIRKVLKARRQTISPIWYIVLADLMTNLTLFFLILYSITRMDVEKQQDMLNALGSSTDRQAGATAKAKAVLKK